jgi:predicted MFS family arabinose efflux permease
VTPDADGGAATGPSGRPATAADRRAVGALVVLALAAFCFVTTEVLPIGLLTVIAGDLDRPRSQIGLLVTVYAVVVVLASLPLVRLTQRVPRRWLLAGTLGVFAVATATSALAPSYDVLLGSRLLIALAQAMFWSVVTSAATGLFPAAIRGRIVARLSIGSALAPVLGVPAGTWLGQQAGWRSAFLVMAGVGLAAGVAVLVLMPTLAPRDSGAARGAEPSARRYLVLVAGTALGVTGFLTAFTYITPFLLDVSGFGPSSLGPLLLASGVAGLAGTLAVATVLDRHPRPALIVPLLVIAAALLGLYALGTVKLAAIALFAAASLAYSALAAAVGSRTLQVAPGSTDIAAAGTSCAFNVGIAAGSFLGGALIEHPGTRSVALVGGLLAASALATLAAESLLVGRGGPRAGLGRSGHRGCLDGGFGRGLGPGTRLVHRSVRRALLALAPAPTGEPDHRRYQQRRGDRREDDRHRAVVGVPEPDQPGAGGEHDEQGRRPVDQPGPDVLDRTG